MADDRVEVGILGHPRQRALDAAVIGDQRIGIAGAVGAVGGFLVPRGFAMSTTGFGSLVPAIGVFIAAYVLMATLTWAVYVRRGARLADEGI